MLVGWGVLSPLSKLHGWAPGPVGDMANGARGWILWISLAIMCTDSLISLLPVIYNIVVEKLVPGRIRLSKFNDQAQQDREIESEDRLVPMSWVLWGTSGSVLIGTALVWFVFGDEGIKPWATLIGYILGALLSVLGYVAFFMLRL